MVDNAFLSSCMLNMQTSCLCKLFTIPEPIASGTVLLYGVVLTVSRLDNPHADGFNQKKFN